MSKEAFYLKLGTTLLLCSVVWGCATSEPIGYSDFDPETDFSAYQTFTFISKNPLARTTVDLANPALEGYLIEEVKSYLTKRGYHYVSRKADADVVIGFAAGSRDTLSSFVYTGTYDHDILYGRIRGIEMHTHSGTEGSLVIDIFEESSASKKWMGWASMEMTMDDEIELQYTVRDLVRIILEHYPPG